MTWMTPAEAADQIEYIVLWSRSMDVATARSFAMLIQDLREWAPEPKHRRVPFRCKVCGKRHLKSQRCPP